MVFYTKTNKSKMSSIPQGAFAAFKVKQNFANSMGSNEAKHFGPFLANEWSFEHPLLKYNSKLMNSIWGLYNRYSVHNLKKNAASGSFKVFENHRL